MPLSPLRVALLLVLVPSIAFAPSSHAVTRTVALDGGADFTVIQDAIEASAEGDTVLVSPGVYTWSNQGSGNEHGLVRYWLTESDDVRLISTHGARSTIIDAEGMGRVFFANGDNSELDPVDILVQGFTLRNGYATKVPNRAQQEGGAVAMHLCRATFVDCIIQDSVAEYGGGVWLGGVGMYEFLDCRFERNHAKVLKPAEIDRPFGGGVMVFGPAGEPNRTSARFEGCTFVGNRSDYRGAGILIGNNTVEIVDCLFAENRVPAGSTRNGTAIYGFNPGSLLLEGVTVRDHDSSPGAAVYLLEYDDDPAPPNPSTSVTIRNTLVSKGASGSGLMISSDGIDQLDVSCTNLWGGFPGNWIGQLLPFRGVAGNLQVDPLFCSAWGDRRMVSPGSLMLAANNECAEDIGRVIGNDCGSVPVVASGLVARREGDGIVLAWQGVDPADAGLTLERIAGDRATRLSLELALDDGATGHLYRDPSAPRTETEYRLLDRDDRLLARAVVPAALSGVRLAGAAPNPFNPRTEISFEIDRASRVRLDLYDSRGRHVRRILDEDRLAGLHRQALDAGDLGSGVYHLRLEAAGQVRTRPVVLVR